MTVAQKMRNITEEVNTKAVQRREELFNLFIEKDLYEEKIKGRAENGFFDYHCPINGGFITSYIAKDENCNTTCWNAEKEVKERLEADGFKVRFTCRSMIIEW